MRYFVTVAGRIYDVRIDGDGISIDGRLVTAELLHVNGTPVHRLTLDGASHKVVAERGAARGVWEFHVNGFRLSAEVVDERTSAIRAMTGESAVQHGPKPIRAPMPGMIIRVEVAPGDHVSAGQGLVIMEAMKMENELKADAAGIVSRIAVQAGTAVEKGTVLIEFDANSRDHG